MPRQSRIELPGSLHHIMGRGIDGQNLFYDKKDYDNFLKRLGKLISGSSNDCFAWVLMKNHFHLLLRSGDEPLSQVMRRLLTGHAVYFNRRHKRTGHLFQNRFKSVLCQEETYFLQLVRYIHLNPIRSGKIKSMMSLNKYPYSGHSYILGNLENEWQNCAYTLKWFDRQKKKSRIDYLEFIKDGLQEGKRHDLTGGGLLRTAGGWSGLKELKRNGQSVMGDERMLGESDFVEGVLKRVDTPDNKLKTPNKNDYTLTKLTQDACNFFNVDPNDVRSVCKQRQVNDVKSLICYIAVRRLNFSGSSVSCHLKISKSAVSRRISGFQKNDNFQRFLDKYILTI
jgi:putative transposase